MQVQGSTSKSSANKRHRQPSSPPRGPSTQPLPFEFANPVVLHVFVRLTVSNQSGRLHGFAFVQDVDDSAQDNDVRHEGHVPLMYIPIPKA